MSAKTEKKGATVQVLTDEDKVQFDANVVSKGVAAILQSAKQGAGMTAQIIEVIRSCKDGNHASATMTYAEGIACTRMGVRTLKELARAHGAAQLSYVALKSSVLSLCEQGSPGKLDKKARELADGLQAFWDYKTSKEGAEKRTLPEGFLDIWHQRYATHEGAKDKGPTIFNRDRKEAEDAIAEHGKIVRAAELARKHEASKAPANANTASTPQQVAGAAPGAPSTSAAIMAEMPESYREALGSVTRAVHAAATQKGVATQTVVHYLNACFAALSKEVDRARKAEQEALAQRKQTPSKAVAEAAKGLPEVPDDAPLTEEDRENMERVA